MPLFVALVASLPGAVLAQATPPTMPSFRIVYAATATATANADLYRWVPNMVNGIAMGGSWVPDGIYGMTAVSNTSSYTDYSYNPPQTITTSVYQHHRTVLITPTPGIMSYYFAAVYVNGAYVGSTSPVYVP